MSIKGRTRFTVAGTHPLLKLTRDHFIKQGFALIPWDSEEKPHFCLIGADLHGSDQLPLAQLELQRMQSVGCRVLLLSTQELAAGTEPVNWDELGPDTVASLLYARCAEHMFTYQDDSPPPVILRPVNIYGPDINWGVINYAFNNARRGEVLRNPGIREAVSTFLHQEDYLRYVDNFVFTGFHGAYNVASTEPCSYHNVLRNIWKFINGPDTEPTIVDSGHPLMNFIPDTQQLELSADWKPKTTIRSGLFKMAQS